MAIHSFKLRINNTLFVLTLLFIGCTGMAGPGTQPDLSEVSPGAYQTKEYLPLLSGKRVGLVVNHSSQIEKTHLLDTLLSLKINVIKVFAPEHGFRGDAADGDIIENEKDMKTGISIVSLYGAKRKPSAEDLQNVDLLVFDIQDVGVRFYTYASTMQYVMEVCAENNKEMVILDRPNPHGGEVDGPILDPKYRSFVGMNKIPVLHGLTLGEMAQMINGENWLENGSHCDLTVIPVSNYTHQTPYSLPVPPSPNLPNDLAIAWYPSLGFFEGTQVSVARGTTFPFQALGYPDSAFGDFSFTPVSIPGVSTNPPHLNEKCYGIDLRNFTPPKGLDLHYLISFYEKFRDKEKFFRSYINLLAGTDSLMMQILEGKSEDEIRNSWQKELDQYKLIRKKYLLYPDSQNE